MKSVLKQTMVEVQSESNPDILYTVMLENCEWTCSCPSFEHSQKDCKHIAHVKPKPAKISKEDLLNGKYKTV